MVVLAILSVVLVAAGLLGWFGFARTERVLQLQQEEALADLTRIMTLAERGTSFGALAAVSVLARDRAELASASDSLHRRLDELRELTAQLPRLEQANRAAPTEVPAIVRLINRLDGITNELVAVTALRLSFDEELAGAVGESEAVAERLISTRLPPQATVFGQAAVAAAMSAATARDEPGLLSAQARFSAALGAFRSSATGASADVLGDDIASLSTIFERKRADLNAAARTRIFAAAISVGSGQLNDFVRSFASRVNAAALDRGNTTLGILNLGRWAFFALGLCCLALVVLAASLLIRDVAANLRGATDALTRLASGDQSAEAPGLTRKDEIGDLARAFSVFKAQALERERLLARLDDNHRLLDAIVRNTDSGIALFDAGNRLLASNPRFVELSGLPPSLLQDGLPAAVIVEALLERGTLSRTLEGRAIAAERLIKAAERDSFSAELAHSDGRTVEVRGVRTPDGWLVVTLSDLTERRTLEERLRQAQRLEAMGRLTGGIAHDFNNLLAAITLNLQLVEGDPALTAATRARVLRALDAAEGGAAMTDQLLAFASRQPLLPEPVETGSRLREVAALLEAGLDPSIDIRVEAEGPNWASVDAAQFDNALVNLVHNARDALAGGNGTFVVLSASAVEDGVRVEVRDDGPGMTSDVLARIFEPFFTTKPFGRGSGLGLSMVYGFVQQSGGTIEVKSSPDGGTAFILTLPAADPPAADGRPAAGAFRVPAGQGGRVLLVDDDPRVLAATADMLDGMGYEVVPAGSMDAAESALANGRFGILLTDIVLGPGGDGRELAARARRADRHILVLLTTGYEGAETVDPEWPVLRKPFRAEALRAALASIESASS